MTTDAGFAANFLTPGARQFIKFCIVGGGSSIVDIGTYNVLLHAGWSPVAAMSVAFVLGVSNSYFWNSRWTFKGRISNARKQIPLFFATNFVGLLLNIAVSALVLIVGARAGWTPSNHTPLETMQMLLFRSAGASGGFSLLALNAAKICAIVVVTVWNFGASKFITFRPPASEQRSATHASPTRDTA